MNKLSQSPKICVARKHIKYHAISRAMFLSVKGPKARALAGMSILYIAERLRMAYSYQKLRMHDSRLTGHTLSYLDLNKVDMTAEEKVNEPKRQSSTTDSIISIRTSIGRINVQANMKKPKFNLYDGARDATEGAQSVC